MITVTVQGDTPELLAAHVAWLNAKLGGNNIVAEVKAKKTADKAIEKAAAKPEPAPQASAEVSADVELANDKTTAPSVGADPIDKAALQKVASAKSKTHGVEKVKDLIAKFGGKNINTTPDERLAELKTALEELA
jgi:hypothetical protein